MQTHRRENTGTGSTESELQQQQQKGRGGQLTSPHVSPPVLSHLSRPWVVLRQLQGAKGNSSSSSSSSSAPSCRKLCHRLHTEALSAWLVWLCCTV
jgi:hypothetical protein